MDAEKRYLGVIYGALLLAFVVVGLGAFTRLTEAGLGCPDWPGCYGFLTVPLTPEKVEQATQAFPNAPVEAQKAWNEMIHRYVAGTLGLVIAAIAWLAWRGQGRSRTLPTILLAVVTFQAALGMWTVTMNLMPIVVMGHLLGGFTTVTLLFLLAVLERKRFRQQHESHEVSEQAGVVPPDAASMAIQDNTTMSGSISGRLKVLTVGALMAVILQIALGGWTSANYAAVVCTQLPICEVDWASSYDASAFHPISPTSETYQYGVLGFEQRVTIHATHRIGAMVVTALVLLLAWRVRRPLGKNTSMLLVGALLLQISLGVTNVVALLPLSVAVAHNVCGLLLLLIMVRTTVLVFSAQPSNASQTSLEESGRLSHG
ncbi:COX15/CtaA family protein [Enterovibrio sp. ZSDZ42]|uniref:COX15/CtaA family protein n=1 Tax=Enterovibrio gelatinilyticus TaxID=2899819 RepID=A0ABT5QZT1_9GAMM|nr:COX15/CtaA family protein [Enterovibrio sp. ZSDZ42]MDD1793519.1 COX15/CtaA family protein [Enterovibrio sp. ZSDZ42]